ncbi:hypothetical protein A0E62_gp35 [Pyrobaculum filamentous virus 1]|uniref:Uncharacterized protein n=1 Tax=Pyrobaculum filamentous virus 1 TaxID=1805492 RepID=A0A140F3M1_PFV1|nr:hypothetical protein A0E62_gp35 [Pyrobaculum filamentous virus 1]AML61181.1 hypothetical protein [Pyrobaculum filamentous virus 1]
MDLVFFISLVVFGYWLSGFITRRYKALSVPYATDSAHFALGMLASTLDAYKMYAVIVMYLVYQFASYIVKRDTVDKDIAVFLSGYVSGIVGGAWLL